MPSIGDGLGVDPDLVRAAEEAGRQAAESLRHPADLVCVFACTRDRDAFAAALRRVREVVRGRTMLGCAADGVIGGGQAVEGTPAVSVWAVWFPRARVSGFALDIERAGSVAQVVGLPDGLNIDRLGILIADPVTFPVTSLVERFNENLPGFPLVGGLVHHAGGRALIAHNETVREGGAVGAIVRGSVGFATGVSQAARPIGPAMTVTKAERNVIYELAGIPAVQKLEEVFTALSFEEREEAAYALSMGLAMNEYAEEHGHGDFIVRSVLQADPETGGLSISDYVSVGRTVRFHVVDTASAQADLATTLSSMRGPRSLRQVDGALLFSCRSRGSGTFPSPDHDVLAVRTTLRTRGVAGFFGRGEIGPVNGRNYVHGLTASVVAFGKPDRDVPLPFRRARVRSGGADG